MNRKFNAFSFLLMWFHEIFAEKSQYVVLRSDDSNFSFHEIFNDKEN